MLQSSPLPAPPNMDNLAKISKKLRAARICRNLTQKQLGAKVNLSESTVSRIESGGSIDTDRLADFSIALGVDAAFFYRNDIDVNQIFRVD